jgi:hypothetical protein
MEPLFRGRVERGKIVLDEPGAMRGLLARFEGKEIALRLTRWRKQRSLQANAYYWGVVIPLLAEHCGYDSEEMHDALKHRFLRDREHEKDGLALVRSSAELDTAAFSEYVENCRRLAAELHVVIPDPQ